MASKVEEEPSAESFLGRQLALFDEGFSFSGYERDLLAMNRGDGTFLNVSGASGIDDIGDGRAAVFADLDNDGDVDVFLRSVHGPGHRLFHNRLGQDSGFVRVTLEGRGGGRDAVGAIVRVGTSAGTQTKVKSAGGGFLAQADPRLLFGLGSDAAAEYVQVTWPSGLEERLPGPAAGQSVRIVEGEGRWTLVEERRFSLPLPPSPEEASWRFVRLSRGGRFPELALQRPDGSARPDGELTAGGGWTLVNFWATWCVPCAREMPALQALSAELGDRLSVVGLSIDELETQDRVAVRARELGVTYPIYLAGEEARARVFRAADIPVPFSLLLDADGRVRDVAAGWSAETEERFRATVTGPAVGHPGGGAAGGGR